MTLIQIKYLGGFRTKCTHPTGAVVETDAPNQKAERFSPTDLVATGIGSCMMTMMALKAQSLSIDLKEMSAEVEKQMANDPKRAIEKIVVRLRSTFTPNSEEQKVLEQAAIDCPAHLSVHANVKVEIDFIWGL